MGRTVIPIDDAKLRNELRRIWDELEGLKSSVEEIKAPVVEEPEVYTLSSETEEKTDNPINPGEPWPPVPTGMSAETGPDEETRNKQDAYLEFTWNNMGAGINYMLAFRKGSPSKWTYRSVDGSDTATSISLREGHLKHGTSYEWQVNSVTEDNEESEYCTIQSKTTWSPTATDVPVVKSIKIKGQELTVKFERLATPNFDKFEIYGDTTSGFTPDSEDPPGTFNNLLGRTENVTFKYTLPADWIDQTIYLMARSCGKDGTFSDFCDEISSTWDAPSEPVPLEATVNIYHKKKDTFAEITFPWEESTDPEGDKIKYEVWYWIVGAEDKVKKITGIKETSVTKDGLEDNVVYGWKVRAIDEHGKESSFCDDQTVNTGLDAVAPANPTGFEIVARGGAFHASWERNSEKDVEQYEIYVNTTGSEATCKLLATIAHPTKKKNLAIGIKTEDLTLTLAGNTNYWFWILAKDVSGNPADKIGHLASSTPPFVSVGEALEVDTVAPPIPYAVELELIPQTGGKKDLAKFVITWDWTPNYS